MQVAVTIRPLKSNSTRRLANQDSDLQLSE